MLTKAKWKCCEAFQAIVVEHMGERLAAPTTRVMDIHFDITSRQAET